MTNLPRIRRRSFRRFLRVLSVAVLTSVQLLLPFYPVMPAIAEDATPSAIVAEPSASPVPSPSPNPSPSDDPTATASAAPSVPPSPLASPDSVATPAAGLSETPVATASAQPTDMTTLTPTPTPSSSPTPTDENQISSPTPTPTNGEVMGTATDGQMTEARESETVMAPNFLTNTRTIKLRYPFNGRYPITYEFGQHSANEYISRMQTLFGVDAHDGIDFGLPYGTDVFAAAPGTVTFAGDGIYGNTVVIEHPWGHSYYGHLSQLTVATGDNVDINTLLGLSGTSGVATGPHLHFGIRPTDFTFGNGYQGLIDPLPYFSDEDPMIDFTTERGGTRRTYRRTFQLEQATLQQNDTTLALTFLTPVANNIGIEIADPKGNTTDVTEAVLGKTAGPLSLVLNIPTTALPLQQPGEYTMTVTTPDGVYDQQKFSWGVLALNPDRNVYQPGDVAEFALAVLDEKGEMVCDAALTLSVTSPSGQQTTLTTANGEINVNKEVCASKEFTLESDYTAYYQTSEPGVYTVSLTAVTANGEHTIDDTVTVATDSPFQIQRITATRIYPILDYPVILAVTPQQNYVGDIVESVPSSFVPSYETSASVQDKWHLTYAIDESSTHHEAITTGNTTQLRWSVNWQAGTTYYLAYSYNAPDISPEFKTIGPLVFYAEPSFGRINLSPTYSENRQWQIAFDAVSIGIATRVSSVGFELQSTTAGIEFSTAVGSPAIDTTTYRSGAASLEVLVSGSAATEGMTYTYATANSADDYYLRAYVNITTLPSTQTKLMVFQDSTPSDQASIRLNTDGTLELWNEEDSAQVGSDSLALATGRWYRLEFRADATTIASTVLDGRIDGVSFASGTVNHANGSRNYALGFITTAATGEVNIDDVALNNDSTTDLNWPGEGRIVHLRPNGTSANTCDAQANYHLLLDEITPNDATDTVLCDVNNDVVTVALDDSSTAGIPSNAEVKIMQTGYRWTGVDTSGAHSVTGRLTVGGTVESGSAVSSTTATYYTNHNSFQNYQASFYDWTPATQVRRVTPTDLDSALATFLAGDATPDSRVSTIWLLVEYSAPEGGRVFSSGFENQLTTSGAEWTTLTNTVDIDTTTKRSGAASLRVQSLGSGTEESLAQSFAYANSNGAYFVRTYLYIATAPSAENRIIEIKNSSATVIAYMTIDNSRVLKLYDEDGQITGTATVPVTTWTRIELKLDASGAGSTDTVEGQMDGNVFATSATRNLSTGVTSLVIGGNLNGEAQTTGDWYFDDVAINLKGWGSYQTDYPGEGKIVHLRPNATGDTSAWAVNIGTCATGDYQCVDEVPISTADGIGTSTNNQIEDMNLDSAATAGISYYDTIKVVAVSAYASNSSTTQNDFRIRLKAAASAPSIESDSVLTNSTTYSAGRTGLAGTYPLTVYTLPLVSTPWTAADLDSAQIGLREIVDSASNIQVAAAWMLVEYATPSGGRVYSSGYELNSATAGIEWASASGSPTVQGTTVRSGSYAQQTTSLSSGTAQYVGHRFNYANVNGAYYLRTYLRVAAAPSAENRLIAITDTAGTARAYLTLDSGRLLRLYDEDGGIGSASPALTLDTWYRVELKLDLTPAGGSQVVEAKIDGAAAFASASNRNISTGVAQFRLGGNLNSEAQTTGNWYFDDIALNQNAGSSQNSYPGDGKIVHLKPNADGDTVSWTNTYTNVDEVTPNDATDVIESTTLDQIEEVNLEATSTPGIGASDTVNLVSVGSRFRNDSITHFSGYRVRLKDAASASQILQSEGIPTFSTDWYTNSQEAPTGSNRPLSYPLTAYKRPDGTNDWTPTVLDSTQIGVQIAYDHNSNNVEVSTLWLLVDYSVQTNITIGGTANGNNGATVKLAINNTLQAQSTTIGGGTWTITNVAEPALNDIVTVWVDSATGDNESTAVTKYSTGNITGMVLNNSVLTIGSNQDTSVSITNLNQYDCTENEDIMHQAASSHLKVEGDSCAGSTTNSYTSEKIEILSGDTLTIETSETLTTYDITIGGTLTSSGNSTYNVSHDWAKTGTFTSSTSTVNLTGTGATTQTLSGTNSFNNLTATGSSARTIKFPSSVTTTVTGTLTLSGASSQLLTLDPSSAATVWTINPTAASASYVSVSYSTNSGVSFCTTNSTNGGNNTGWSISTSSICQSASYSQQRKTWYDGTRYWRSSQDISNSRIMFEYSTDGSSWTEDTSARISTNTQDFSVFADSSNAYVAYTTTSVANTDNLLNGSNLAAYWKMNETSWNGTANEVVDSTTNSIDGVRVNNATTTSSGKFSYAGTFDGTDDYVSVTDPGTSSALDITSTISLAAWVYPTSIPASGNWASIVTKGGTDDTNDQNYQMLIGNAAGTEVITFCFASGANLYCGDASGMDLVANSWQHVAITYTFGTASSFKAYHNGVEYAGSWTSSPGTNTPTANNKDLWIGADDYDDANVTPQEEFSGRIDDLRIYNTILTSADMDSLATPGYDVEVRKASSYPGTSFAWSDPTVALNGASSSDLFQYPAITQDSTGKVWLTATYKNSTTYDTYAVRSTTANDSTAWDTATSLDSSSNSNRYAIIVPRTSSAAYAIWMDGTAIEGKNYNGTAWDGSPTAIDTGVTGVTKSLSAVGDSSGNVYLAYVEDLATDQISHAKWNGTSWTTPVLVADGASDSDAYPTLSLDTTASRLYAFWIDTSNSYIYYASCDATSSCDSAAEWDAEVQWKNSGANTYISSNYSDAGKIYAVWANGATIAWDKLSVGGNSSPNSPTSAAQKTVADATLATGDWVSATSIKFTATATDPDSSDTLYLCVEKDTISTAFSNTEDSCGTGVAYSGTGVTVTVTISSQTDATEYHWQARVKDAAGAYSSWVSYGANSDTTPGAARDYGLDTTAPTGGTVYDGTSAGVDTNFSDSSLTTLSANWASFDANVSGLNKYQYSIGTSAGGTDIKTWTDNGTTTSVTATSLTLQTSQLYYVNVRAVDNAGNTGGTVSSNGQIVAPSISFSVSPATVTFNNLSAGNSYTDTNATTLTTSTNAYNGYVVRAFIVDYLRSPESTYTIGDFSGGTYASPATWSGSETGYGYTSSDTTIQGANKFGTGTLYAPFSHTGPGDIIADHTTTVSGSPITNEQFTITHKVKTTATQAATKYTTTVVYTATAQY